MANDIKSAFQQLNDVIVNVPKETLTEVGQFAVAVITLRTRKGLDADRDRFKPYTQAYAKKRLRTGYAATPPDLTIKGHMLGSLVPRVTSDNEVTVEFSGTKEIAKAVGNARTRDFFDIRNDAELDAVASIFGDRLVAEIIK